MAVTVQNVKDLMVISNDPADLSLHLATAQLIVTEDLTGKGLSADRLDKITLFLAAHFATLGLEKGGLRHKTVGATAESFHDPSTTDTGYMSTRFGQQAMALDTSGTLLENASTNLPAEFRMVKSDDDLNSWGR